MRDTLYPYIGHQIQTIRQKKGYTQTDLARLLDLSRTTVVNIEQGRQAVMLHTLITLTHAFHVSLSEFLPTNIPVEPTKKTSTAFPTNVVKDMEPEDRALMKDRFKEFISHENS